MVARMIKHKQPNSKNAQAITEMAVFGVVLIFIIGAIVRQGLSASTAQNQNLKAMRIVLRMSLISSQQGQAKRNSARVLFIEDRLAPEFGKYGALSRTPSFAQASGTMTNLLFMPVDLGEEYNLPVMDVIVNGKHFEFTNARFVEHELLPDRIITRVPNNMEADGVCNPVSLGGSCIKERTDAEYHNLVNEWDVGRGVRRFYTYIPNTNRQSFCVSRGGCGLLTLNETFDLNRNGNFGDDPQTLEERAEMAWQWRAIEGFADNVDIDVKEGTYPSLDVDGDGSEETLYRIVSTYPNGAIRRVLVLDYNEGDVDGAWNEYSPGPRPGILQDTSIYTFNDDETYLEVREGNLYIPGTNQYVRSAREKDQVDVITRLFQLSNNTDRFCTRNAETGVYIPNGNPVTACNDCTSRFNISKICYDTRANVMFIRSRLLDRSGSKWITDVTNELD